MKSIVQKLNETRHYIFSKTKLRPRVAVTLGSGLSHFSEELQIDREFLYEDIPHFLPPSVEGHPGALLIGHLNQTPVAVLQGRVHYYEGHNLNEVTFPTRTLGWLGVQKLLLTNAAGGLDPNMKPGQFMIIKDHINLTGENPLRGINAPELGPRFPDMSEPYCKELAQVLKDCLDSQKALFSEGVYCGVQGPCYETAAEVRYLGLIGGHAVGMSTVPEVIVARHQGMRVAGLSCITNLGTGLSTKPLEHGEVQEVAAQSATVFKAVVRDFLERVG